MNNSPVKKSRIKIGMPLLANMLKRFIKKGTLRLIEADGTLNEVVGSPTPVATIRLHDPSLPMKMFRNPELHTGEAYMNGTLTFEDCTLEDFLNLFSINRGAIASYPMQKVLRRVSRSLRSIQQHNPIGKAQKNVSHHYDLSSELYRLFLDKDLQYSCAYFENGDESLEDAQEKKKGISLQSLSWKMASASSILAAAGEEWPFIWHNMPRLKCSESPCLQNNTVSQLKELSSCT